LPSLPPDDPPPAPPSGGPAPGPSPEPAPGGSSPLSSPDGSGSGGPSQPPAASAPIPPEPPKGYNVAAGVPSNDNATPEPAPTAMPIAVGDYEPAGPVMMTAGDDGKKGPGKTTPPVSKPTAPEDPSGTTERNTPAAARELSSSSREELNTLGRKAQQALLEL